MSLTHEQESEKRIRIGKLLARAGLAPRRATATYLEEHDVRVDGTRITELNYALAEADIPLCKITVDGKTISFQAAASVLLFHKPKGVVSSHRTQKVRGKDLQTIFDFLPQQYKSWFFAGRLDVSSSGLIVLSNDGDHIFELSHPRHGILKKYFVRTSRPLSPADMARAEKGIMDKGERLRFEKVVPLAKPAHYEMHLKEGKNREIRRVLERLGVFARELVRIQLGPYLLGDLAPGKFAEMPRAVLAE
ncbi:MAG: rRNA pseudouridine synthase [Spirochaetes bacterium]|nr:rRNA pseudouridine synthase [Spirochaetota bacterium]